ncbi:MAG: hypothetical protein A2Z55_06435 [Burkholderiales bacterium RIFCSPHIGHO2_12_63_9]|nr:MAG: hypothetical protein A2Z55_06435 [Burkholderiales bacterium RIFCSPHIGHO2_12_63_9]
MGADMEGLRQQALAVQFPCHTCAMRRMAGMELAQYDSTAFARSNRLPSMERSEMELTPRVRPKAARAVDPSIE